MKQTNPLPATCRGCPFYSEEKNFVPDSLPNNSELHIILLSPTYQASSTGQPDTSDVQRGLRLSGVEDISVSHLLRCAVPPKAPSAAVQRGAQHCAQYNNYPAVPMVGVGKEVFRFFSSNDDIYTWRGFRVEVQV